MRGAIWLLDLFYFCTGGIATKFAITASLYSNMVKAAVGVVAPAAVINL